jgi:hypothetical protein
VAPELAKGLEVEVGGWFDGTHFLKPTFIGFKYDRFGSGDVGPNTRGMGAVGFYRTKSILFNKSVAKTETFLKSIEYIGYIGLDCLINNDNLQVVKWQPGLHYPLITMFSALHNSIGNFLFKLAIQKAKVVAVQPDKLGICVALLKSTTEGFKSYPTEMKYALGGTIEEVIIKMYKNIKRLNVGNSYYRIDIGYDAQERINQLIKWGWC